MNDKGYKIIAVIALVIGVVGVTLGYAAFSSTLQINSSAEVTPSGDKFNVDFSSSNSEVETDPVTPELNKVATGFSATNGTISNTGNPTISNLKATFTEPGQTVTYTFYAYNIGSYIAYLNSITFTGSKTCTARAYTDQTLVNSACNGIGLSVKVGSEDPVTSTVGSITGHTLAKNTPEQVDVVISYSAGSAIADGDFDVTLPAITLTYDSAD